MNLESKIDICNTPLICARCHKLKCADDFKLFAEKYACAPMSVLITIFFKALHEPVAVCNDCMKSDDGIKEVDHV